MGLGALAGIASISICVPFPVLASTPVLELLKFSTIPHLVWDTVVGVVAGYGLRAAPARPRAGIV